jgi:hypothetical protein
MFESKQVHFTSDTALVVIDRYFYRYYPEKNIFYQPYIYFFSIKNNKLLLKDTIPFMSGKEIIYSPLVGNYVDVYGDKLIIGNAVHHSFQMIDLISKKRTFLTIDTPRVHLNLDTLDLNKYEWDFNKLIYDMKVLDIRYPRFEKFFLSDDSTLYVSYKPANSGFKIRYIYRYRIRGNNVVLNKVFIHRPGRGLFIRKTEDLFNFTNSCRMFIINDKIYFLAHKIPKFRLFYTWIRYLRRALNNKLNMMLYVYAIQ